MKIISTYSVKIKHYNRIFKDTAGIYRDAVDFFIGVALNEWQKFECLAMSNDAVSVMEGMTHRTAQRLEPKYDFDEKFYKFPSYLRRSAIMEAVGDVSAYMSNFASWEAGGRREKQPGIPRAGRTFPVLYKKNMFLQGDNPYIAKVKIFRNNDWVWLGITLKKGDVDYILRNCESRAQKSPKLTLRGKEWYLDFPFEEKRKLQDTHITKRLILAADLGINNACVCSVMGADGTIYGRHFLRLPEETDRLWTTIGRIKKAQQHGARYIPGKWAVADGMNDRIAVLTAQFIMDIAVLYNVDVIVFEHLDLDGKKRGSRKQRLHLWKARDVQGMVEHKAHRAGMRISRVCAWGTSRLAYDGSGRVSRGEYVQDGVTKYNYSICVFQNGKIYNCDLNASYNIGARYFIREVLKSLPGKARLELEAKVPSASRRSTSTLSTLISLHAAIAG